jgi:hypothetical protein
MLAIKTTNRRKVRAGFCIKEREQLQRTFHAQVVFSLHANFFVSTRRIACRAAKISAAPEELRRSPKLPA